MILEHPVRLSLWPDCNKSRKLKYNIEPARAHGTVLTFGGAYSNHIRATAAAGRLHGFRTIGVIRGEEHLPLNASLRYAVSQGMELTYLDRDRYRRKEVPAGDYYVLPEGGSNSLAVRGCAELPGEIPIDFDVITVACGTGATLAGIAAGLSAGQRAIGFSALKGSFMAGAVADFQRSTFGTVTANWTVENGFHFGGFARRTPELNTFITDFEGRHGVRLEWVYVAKMLYGVLRLVERGAIAAGSRVVAVVTG